MDTNYQMLLKLDTTYTPREWGIVNGEERKKIESTLHVKEMDILQLRNLRDFVVLYYHSQRHDDPSLISMDKMSAIVYIIDKEIIEKGGEI